MSEKSEKSGILLIPRFPKTEPEKNDLAAEAAKAHADAILFRLHALPCPNRQKQLLLDEIIRFFQKKCSAPQQNTSSEL